MQHAERVFAGPKFTVERRRVAGSDGREHPFDVIVHSGAAVILPVHDDGRIVLIENRRHAVEADLLELPAGTIDPPEEPIDCARREIVEETGFSAARIEPLCCFYSSPGICTERMHAFLATGLTPGPTAHEPLESIRVLTLPLDEALRQVRSGCIMDGKTIATLLFYDRFVREAQSG